MVLHKRVQRDQAKPKTYLCGKSVHRTSTAVGKAIAYQSGGVPGGRSSESTPFPDSSDPKSNFCKGSAGPDTHLLLVLCPNLELPLCRYDGEEMWHGVGTAQSGKMKVVGVGSDRDLKPDSAGASNHPSAAATHIVAPMATRCVFKLLLKCSSWGLMPLFF